MRQQRTNQQPPKREAPKFGEMQAAREAYTTQWRGEVRKTFESEQAKTRIMVSARKTFSHGEWTNWVKEDLGISADTAEMYLAIGRDPKLQKPELARVLPPYASTWEVLTHFTQDYFDACIKDKRIHPNMTRRKAQYLLRVMRARQQHAIAKQGSLSDGTTSDSSEAPTDPEVLMKERQKRSTALDQVCLEFAAQMDDDQYGEGAKHLAEQVTDLRGKLFDIETENFAAQLSDDEIKAVVELLDDAIDILRKAKRIVDGRSDRDDPAAHDRAPEPDTVFQPTFTAKDFDTHKPKPGEQSRSASAQRAVASIERYKNKTRNGDDRPEARP